MSASKLDLDIEFEDEDESKRLEEERKKREEVKDVDLQFSMDDEDDASEDNGATGVALKKAQAEARRAALEKKQTAQGQNVADIGQARKAREPVVQNTPAQHNANSEPTEKPQPTSIPVQQQAPTPIRPSASSPHYRLGDELNYAMEVNTLLSAEVQARVQLAVAQAQTEIIARAAQEAKLLEHKVVKLLTQINAKAPAAKAELMAIKKMLAENADPKKLFEESAPASEKAEAPKKKASGS